MHKEEEKMLKKLESKVNIVKKFNIFGTIGLVFALLGIVSVILLPFGVELFDFDIDFKGGTTITYNLHKTLDTKELDKIEKAVEEATGAAVSSVQKSGEKGEEVIVKAGTLSDKQRAAAFAAMQESYKITNADVSETTVDAVVGNDLRDAAITAALIAILCMLAYIAIRFDWRSGLAAVCALAHDVFVVMGAYVVFGIPLNMTFIAVVLTILGYSINATIVVFDRIRENKKNMKKTSFADVVNTSIYQTLTRSINTTVTTLLAVVLIAILGVTSVKEFAIPLIAGIVAGLYSSVFIAGPVWTKLAKK